MSNELIQEFSSLKISIPEAKQVGWKQLNRCIDILRSMNIIFSTEVTFDGLKDSKDLRFDIMPIIPYKNTPNIICIIEVDGSQHFRKGGFGKGEEDFIKQKIHDYMKILFCRKHSLSILRISFKEMGDELSIITNFINEVKSGRYVEMYSNPTLYSDQKAITIERLEKLKNNNTLIITTEPPKPNRVPVKITSSSSKEIPQSSITAERAPLCKIG